MRNLSSLYRDYRKRIAVKSERERPDGFGRHLWNTDELGNEWGREPQNYAHSFQAANPIEGTT